MDELAILAGREQSASAWKLDWNAREHSWSGEIANLHRRRALLFGALVRQTSESDGRFAFRRPRRTYAALPDRRHPKRQLPPGYCTVNVAVVIVTGFVWAAVVP